MRQPNNHEPSFQRHCSPSRQPSQMPAPNEEMRSSSAASSVAADECRSEKQAARATSYRRANQRPPPAHTVCTPRRVLLFQLSLLAGLASQLVQVTQAIECFKCSSRNGSNRACEDPFHNLKTVRITTPMLPDPPPNVVYHTPCYAGKKGREGLFPASACVKLTGTFVGTGETLVVRHCALDSGTLTQDTELARMSHCGKFQFDGDLIRGCVLACPDDACNSAPPNTQPPSPTMQLVIPLLVVLLVILAPCLNCAPPAAGLWWSKGLAARFSDASSIPAHKSLPRAASPGAPTVHSVLSSLRTTVTTTTTTETSSSPLAPTATTATAIKMKNN